MRRLADLRQQAETWRSLETRARVLAGLLELAAPEGDGGLAVEIGRAGGAASPPPPH